MYDRSRMIVAILSSQKEDRWPEFWESRFPRASQIEEILLASVWWRCSEIVEELLPNKIQEEEMGYIPVSTFGATDG
ncbi:hypothetical protein EPN81_03950 [Patescibacteria group bacterium]|nr:MAG: hypothetical protein EPN81_03950 [Patescibacteria group bacterium]